MWYEILGLSGEGCRNLKRGQTTGFPCQMRETYAIFVLSRQKNGRVIT